jgi:hypothetical protein
MTIFKYPLHVGDDITIAMPRGARLLSVQVQAGTPCVWAIVDPSAPSVRRRLVLRGTGHNAEGLSMAPFVGTFQLEGGAFIGHLFDLGEVQS